MSQESSNAENINVKKHLRNWMPFINSLLQHNDESFHRNKTGNKLQLSGMMSVTDGGIFNCQVGNIIGTSSMSLNATVTVEGTFNSCFLFW